MNCINIKGSPVCGSNVTGSMAHTYFQCRNLTGPPVCGNNVTSLFQAYQACTNLTGSPVCGNKVTSMYWAYASCTNLKGSPVCGPNVTNMEGAYSSCYNLTGSPVCGNNVTTIRYAYANCTNLGRNITSDIILARNNVVDMGNAYFGCTNLGTNRAYHNFYIYSKEVTVMTNCFYNCNFLNPSYRVNIYVPNGSNTLKLISNNSQSVNIFGKQINWTNYTNYYYNGTYFIYIYKNKIS